MTAFICPSCDNPNWVHEEADPNMCLHCQAVWCAECEYKKRVKRFHYSSDENAPMKCDFCFPTKPLRIRDSDLLDYALERLGSSKKRLTEQMLADGPIQFRVAPNPKFECQIHIEGYCASSECHRVSQPQKIYRDVDDDWYGYCCEESHGSRLDFKGYCKGCLRWKARPLVITLLGIRKLRKHSVLASVPRDVLINCIMKPFLWPN